MSDGARSFTSWKMDWINVLMAGLDHREFRVAVCLLQRANSSTRVIVPSQAYIAAYLNCSIRPVERSIAKLVEDGWLEKRRPRRYLPNSYRFVEAKRETFSHVVEGRLANYKAERWGEMDPEEATGPAEEATGPDGGLDPEDVTQKAEDVTGKDPEDVTGKHLIEHLPSTSESSVGGAARERKVIEVSPELRARLLGRRSA